MKVLDGFLTTASCYLLRYNGTFNEGVRDRKERKRKRDETILGRPQRYQEYGYESGKTMRTERERRGRKTKGRDAEKRGVLDLEN
jgi:hypothetical protein